MHAYFFIFLFFFYFSIFIAISIFFIIYLFGAGPQHAWTSFMRAWHCAKVISYLRTVLNALKFRNKNEEEEKAYLAAGYFAGVLACWAKISGGVRW
jgi:hypothetical protein